MKSRQSQENWTNLLARRPPTHDERVRLAAWLARHPEARSDLDLEVGLSEALARLPKPVASSNFTAQVMHRAIGTAEARFRPDAPSRWRRLIAGPITWKAALACLALGVTLLGVRQYRTWQDVRLARVLASLPVESLARNELLLDFEEIRLLPAEPLPPAERLAEALQ